MILGNLDVNKIRGSLEDLFADSDKQAEIQYDAADSYQKTYDVYTKTLDKYKSMSKVVDKAIAGKAKEEDYADFSNEFKDAIKKIRDAETQIADSKNKISDGEKKLSASKSQYNSGKATATSKKNSLTTTKKEIESGIEKCKSGLKEIDEGIAKCDSTTNDLQTKLGQVNAGLQQCIVALSTATNEAEISAYTAKVAELKQDKAKIEAGISQAESKKKELESKKTEIQATQKDLESKLSQVKSGMTQIDSSLSSAQTQISNAENKIKSSKSQLEQAEKQLEDSKKELKSKTIEGLYTSIADGVYDEAIKDNDEETAQKSKDMAKQIMDAYIAGKDTSKDAIRKMAKNYVADAVYDEAIKNHSEEDSNTAKEVAATAIDDYCNKIDNGTSQEDALNSISRSLIDQLPDDVESAILEIKDMDVYGLVVGNILYRIAGLLLPMIFVIMTANSLLAGQVDSGSMAYVLSTPTKRSKVAITQMVYLIFSVLSMYICIGTTSVICMKLIKDSEVTVTIDEVIKFNVGAFFVMFAVSGICYLASAIFNREKNSLSVGGGLTMFFLVCSILGLFGEKVIPSAIRIEAMNYFNYASIISLFNVQSILDGTTAYINGFLILFVIGMISYIIGIMKFDRKDLPL